MTAGAAGRAKLHGLAWGQGKGVVVDVKESVVDDGAGSTIVLGDDAQGAESEVCQLRH